MQNIPIRLKELRQKNGLTQAEMASKVGMVQQAWQKLESGKVPDMRASTIINICETMNVSADWLLGIVDTQPDDTLTQFYMDVIDTINDYGDDELIKDDIAYKLMREVTTIKARYQNND